MVFDPTPEPLDYHIKAGDLSPNLRVRCTNADGNQNLAGAAAVLVLADGVTLDLVVETPQSDADKMGWVHHVWAAGETDDASSREFEIQVTYSDDTTQTFPFGLARPRLIITEKFIPAP